jgi:hypothetical protein
MLKIVVPTLATTAPSGQVSPIKTGSTMTPAQLRALIESDAQALALARSGASDQCAIRCTAIAPKVLTPTRMTELGVMAVYPDGTTGEAVLQQIEAVAAQNPIVARVAKWMLPGAIGVDFADVRVRAIWTLPVASGGIGLTTAQAAPLLAAAESAPTISGADVQTAYPFTP